LVNWQTLEDHSEGFRQSAEYQQWLNLLHHFYDPFPTVEHYSGVFENNSGVFENNSGVSENSKGENQ
jgi:heme-degrading monooxygenase HmoA